MKIIIAPDSFKGSLPAVDVASSMARGVGKVLPDAQLMQFPLSDGGEGLVDSLVRCTKGIMFSEKVTGPLGELVEAFWGIMGDGKTAVIEMASASGLHLVSEDKRNPLITTTYGTGELIKCALRKGCSRIIVGTGGSVTNDGGAGMAQALGVKFLDNRGKPLPFGGESLSYLNTIDITGLDPRLENTEILVACDVSNPLTGLQGASYIYGPQKGATDEMVLLLDKAIEHYASIIARDLGVDIKDVPGAGSGGGAGAGLLAFLKGELKSGIDLVINVIGLEKELPSCNLLLTGEGALDAQSTFGKVPIGIARKAAAYRVPVVVLAGTIDGQKETFYRQGITACFSIVNRPMSLQDSMESVAELIELVTVDILRLWNSANQSTKNVG
jgi:glycerate kinase